MKLEWMGPYRPLVEEYIKAANRYARRYRRPGFTWQGLPVSAASIQVLEYILENEDLNQPMARLAERLGVTRGAFSKTVAQLCAQGLVEKRRPPASGREYWLSLTEKGRGLYAAYSSFIREALFDAVFVELRALPPEALEASLRVLRLINASQA